MSPTATIQPSLQPKLKGALSQVGQLLWADRFPILLFMGLAVLALYPVIAAPRTTILGDVGGDNVQYVFLTGWFTKALRLAWNPFYDPYLNYPAGLQLLTTDVPYLSLIAVAPITYIFGPVFAYNLLIFFSHFASGYFTYLWAKHLTSSQFGGLVSGVVFMLAPYRLMQSNGHLQLVSTEFIPLFFWALGSALAPQSRPRTLVGLGLATFLVGGSSQYYLVICLVLGGVYTVLASVGNWGQLKRWPWVLAAVMAGALLSAWPYFAALHGQPAYDIEGTRIWSASILDFLIPARFHPLWGGLIRQNYPEWGAIDFTLYLGWVAIGLAVIGVRYANPDIKQRVPAWLGVSLVGIVLALGTDFHWARDPLQPTNPFWLPSYYLGQLPFLNFMRVWARYGIVPILLTAILAGVGATWLWHRFATKWLTVAVCLGLLLIDFAPLQLQAVTLQPRPIDLWLAQQRETFPVAFLPPAVNNNVDTYGSLFSFKPIPAYEHPNHMPLETYEFIQIGAALPSTDAFHALSQKGFKYLIFWRSAYNGKNYPAWETIAAALTKNGFSTVADIDGYLVVKPPAQP